MEVESKFVKHTANQVVSDVHVHSSLGQSIQPLGKHGVVIETVFRVPISANISESLNINTKLVKECIQNASRIVVPAKKPV